MLSILQVQIHSMRSKLSHFLRMGSMSYVKNQSPPMQRNYARMIEAAKENDVLLMEALKTTLLPNFKAIQRKFT